MVSASVGFDNSVVVELDIASSVVASASVDVTMVALVVMSVLVSGAIDVGVVSPLKTKSIEL